LLVYIRSTTYHVSLVSVQIFVELMRPQSKYWHVFLWRFLVELKCWIASKLDSRQSKSDRLSPRWMLWYLSFVCMSWRFSGENWRQDPDTIGKWNKTEDTEMFESTEELIAPFVFLKCQNSLRLHTKTTICWWNNYEIPIAFHQIDPCCVYFGDLLMICLNISVFCPKSKIYCYCLLSISKNMQKYMKWIFRCSFYASRTHIRYCLFLVKQFNHVQLDTIQYAADTGWFTEITIDNKRIILSPVVFFLDHPVLWCIKRNKCIHLKCIHKNDGGAELTGADALHKKK